MAKTLANLTTEVETRLGDTTNTIWSEAEIKALIKEGYDDLCLSTLILWKRDTSAITDVDGTATYSLPTDLYKVDRITWKNSVITPWTAREARESSTYYQSTEGNVVAYVMELDGIGTIRLINVPAANGSFTVLEYYRRGATLSADGTELELPDRYTDYVAWYAMARALERDGPGQDPEMAAHYHTRYVEGVKRIKRRMSQVRASRIGKFGGADEDVPRLGDPMWPSNYGRTVRVRY